MLVWNRLQDPLGVGDGSAGSNGAGAAQRALATYLEEIGWALAA